MESYSVHYKFSQHFDFPVKDAFDWSMDYDEDDIARTGKEGTRRIERINGDTLVLTDTFFTGKEKDVRRRLIRIYPERLTMINTRLSAGSRHSQFIYEFVSEGKKSSRLDFTGAHVFYGKKPSPSKVAALAREMTEGDADIWKRLAAEMKNDLSQE
jgi:hypothetical protein